MSTTTSAATSVEFRELHGLQKT